MMTIPRTHCMMIFFLCHDEARDDLRLLQRVLHSVAIRCSMLQCVAVS